MQQSIADAVPSKANPALTAAMGAIAGAVGVWALDRVDWFLWNRQDPEAKARTKAVRPYGEDPAGVVVSALEDATGRELGDSQHKAAQQLVHYSIGIGPAAAYALVRDKLPGRGPVRGLLYGAGVFLVFDEAVNAASGLGADLRKYPWQDHARGLVSHLAYGVATELALNAMEHVLDTAEQHNGSGPATGDQSFVTGKPAPEAAR